MRENYTTPEMEIIEFEVEDIITASGDPDELPTMPKEQEMFIIYSIYGEKVRQIL